MATMKKPQNHVLPRVTNIYRYAISGIVNDGLKIKIDKFKITIWNACRQSYFMFNIFIRLMN